MAQTSTFVFDDGGVAYLHDGTQIVASSRNLEELEKLADMMGGGMGAPIPGSMPPSPTSQAPVPCPNCGGSHAPGMCPTGDPSGVSQVMPGQTLSAHDHKEDRKEEDDARTKTDEHEPEDDKLPWEKATHVTTPNGIRGKIVGHARNIWGTEVTIRLENGRIASYDVVAGQNYKYENENAPTIDINHLTSKLAEVPTPNRKGLLQRIEDLKDVRKSATILASGADYNESEVLNEMILTANHEIKVAVDAIKEIDAMGYENPAPYTHSAVEQVSRSRDDSSWLGDTYKEAMREAYATDYDKLMDEGPETVVASLETPVLFDQEAVHYIANQFVTSNTVGLDANAINAFRQAFLTRVEEVRVKESSTRPDSEQEVQTRQAQKTAKRIEEELTDSNDEGLFL